MSNQGTVDAVLVAAQLVTALQAIVSRNVAPTESAVVTIGKIEVHGDSALVGEKPLIY